MLGDEFPRRPVHVSNELEQHADIELNVIASKRIKLPVRAQSFTTSIASALYRHFLYKTISYRYL